MTDSTFEKADYRQTLTGLFDLHGRVAFVPGGYGGIGEAISWGLALAGARVAIAGRSADKAEALASQLRDAGLDAHGLAMDAHSVAEIQTAIDATAQRFGELNEETFDEIVTVNLKAAVFMAQAAARHQAAAVEAGRSPGRQVHLLSVRAQLGMRDRGYTAYCTTKGALAMLVKQHAVELCAHGITVNGVAPTVVRGEMGHHWLANPVTREQVLKRIPLGRVAEPEDVVGATLFFCSPAAAFVTGQVLYVDGGLTATQ